MRFWDGSGGYVLRQDKKHPKKIVYFGGCKRFNQIFKGYLFQVDANGCSGFGGDDFGVYARNVVSGRQTYLGWLSNKTINCESFEGNHFPYQDSVNFLKVDNGRLIINVTRCKSGYDAHDENDIDTDYELIVERLGGVFKAKFRRILAETDMSVDKNCE
jgi:hypothetical protein